MIVEHTGGKEQIEGGGSLELHYKAANDKNKSYVITLLNQCLPASQVNPAYNHEIVPKEEEKAKDIDVQVESIGSPSSNTSHARL